VVPLVYQLPVILCCSEMRLINQDPVPRIDGFDSALLNLKSIFMAL